MIDTSFFQWLYNYMINLRTTFQNLSLEKHITEEKAG